MHDAPAASSRPLRFRLALGVVALLGVILLAALWRPIWQASHLATLRACMPPAFQHQVFVGSEPDAYEWVVALDRWAEALTRRWSAPNTAMARYSNGYRYQFRELFRPSIDSMNIHGSLKKDVGGKISPFKDLRRLIVTDPNDDPSHEEVWIHLCREVRACPKLETLNLSGINLTDDALALLRGHPSLRELTVRNSDLTPACADTLAALPELNRFTVSHQYSHITPKPALKKEDLHAMAAKLPHVKFGR
jgi:hypothetical protein